MLGPSGGDSGEAEEARGGGSPEASARGVRGRVGGDERGGDLRALWRLANQKAAEVWMAGSPYHLFFLSFFSV